MTEQQLIETLRTLIADQRSAIAANNCAANNWTAKGPYAAYHEAMLAVVDRYRKTNPYTEVPPEATEMTQEDENYA